ncbi:poly-gamma-glutamate biosynthesis protein PgsC/CapC [Halomonas sp. GXIMD04776]|uniref:poly-gamma-glutamate biosynthesis protein PgsC/CapC n=1 Tax=Halomonas sp. GXIMD04776 TaxID=3415605 RepID=UPI003CB179CB
MEFFFHPELVRLGFIAGVAASIGLYEKRQLTTGGIAVPGYLGFAIFAPGIAIAAMLSASLVYAAVHVLLPRVLFMTKRAKFSASIVGSALLNVGLHAVLPQLGLTGGSSPLLAGMGYIVPGLIAHDMSRHGIAQTTLNITAASAAVGALLLAAVSLLPRFAEMPPAIGEAGLAFDLALLPVAVFFSVAAWFGIARRRDWRCAGFVGGAYLSILATKPVELAVFVGLAAVTLLVVTRLLEPRMVLFGRRKFAAVLLVGSCLSWSLFWLQKIIGGGITLTVLSPSLTAVSVLLTGLLAADVTRVGLPRTVLGVSANVLFTLSGTLLIVEILGAGRAVVIVGLATILATVAAVIYAPSLRLFKRTRPSTPQKGSAP